MRITPPPEQDRHKGKVLGFENYDRFNKFDKHSKFG